MERVYNFSPGPSMLAQPVLEKAQKDLMVYGATLPCAAYAAIPCGLAVCKQHKMLFAASK